MYLLRKMQLLQKRSHLVLFEEFLAVTSYEQSKEMC